MNITDELIGELFQLSQYRLPDDVVQQAKRCLIDYLGVAFAGSQMLKLKGEKLLYVFDTTSAGATVIGFNRKAPMQQAAFINGLSAHVSELDDGVRFGNIHPGAPIISALLALVEKKKISGEKFIQGLVVGYETAIRIANAIQPSHRNLGYHATGTCGTLGVALAIASALEYTKAEMKHTLSSAATSASGLLQVIKGKSDLKPVNSAQAALNGLTAAFVAGSGFEGPDDVLADEWGFLSMVSDEVNSSKLRSRPDGKLQISNVYIKPYAACRHCHPIIEAVLQLRSEFKLNPLDVKEVKVTTYELGVGGHDHQKIEGVSSAKMSTPFSVAVALIKGKASIEEFSPENIKDQEIRSLAQKVTVLHDERLSRLVPDKRPAIVEIKTKQDELYSMRVDLAKGEPENPISNEELMDKYKALCRYGQKSIEDSDALANIVWNLESDMNKLYRYL